MNSAFIPDSPNHFQEKTQADAQILRSKELSASELLWSKHYQFLKDRGYTLRKRYEPGWKASWLSGHLKISECEDSVLLFQGHTIDATRYDGMLVALKKIDLWSDYTEEIEIGKLLSSPELSQDPRNHCVPILDVLYPPGDAGLAFVVMPLLYNTQLAPFETIGEVVEYIRQIFEGLHFMHENGVAHGDCTDNNIMADSLHLFASAPHPGKPSMTLDYSDKVSKSDSRTNKPVKYYLVGFHKSINYRNQDGQEKEVDKSSKHQFAADVYCLGDMLRMHFLDGWDNMGIAPKQGFEFMRKLISDMMNGDPNRRPDMGKVVARFNSLVDDLSDIQLRSPVIPAGESLGVYKLASHWTKQFVYMARGIPPIPMVDF
ncbi:hypothetical protein C0995_014417 [Termitomyces sp. Mi166|nr:hypothetical protein C0995_014417 [Termitomyces sp. Mi166\